MMRFQKRFSNVGTFSKTFHYDAILYIARFQKRNSTLLNKSLCGVSRETIYGNSGRLWRICGAVDF